ncbi:MAG: right-handed parallel beta-helix repeat-containing protein [Bacteroidota bacterium]
MKILTGLTLFLFIVFSACRKDSFISSADARVRITVDTLKYDTVFTSTGSITQSFKIVNENNQKLKVSSVKLMGAASSYSINVDGTSGPAVNDLEINANDSMYVFVQVNVNPDANNLPFVIRDSIQVSINGKNNLVQLEAWGKNAHFLRDKQVSSDEHWDNDLPYVILGYLYVGPGKTLTINKGCRIYAHADAAIIVDGTLKVAGEKDTIDRVYFRGDRLDDPYKDYPASWPGIYFRTTSQDNVLNFAVIKNAYQAIALQDPSIDANPKLTLNESIIDNAYDAGIISLNSSVKATNCLISNCGKNLVLAQGGNYQFTHCTVASYSNSYILHKDPVLYLSNYIVVNNAPVTKDLTAVFTNNIFWGDYGSVDDEVVTGKDDGALFNVSFDSNIWKVKTQPTGIDPLVNAISQAPGFDSIDVNKKYYNFHLKTDPLSPAIDAGTNTSNTIDLDGKPRPVGQPDLGCYEKQ